MRVTRARKTVFGVCVAVLLVTGLALLLANTALFMAVFRWQLVLSPTSGSFPMWHTLPEPLLTSFYLFKVINPSAVSAGARPHLEQVGPYVFREQHEKTGLVWNNNNHTVTYKQIRTWKFVPHLSNGSLDDEVTILNSVAASLGPMIKEHVSSLVIPAVNVILKDVNEKLFVTKPVREILFDGYHDPVFDDLENLEKFLPFIKDLIPPGGITDRFAFFYQRNGSDSVDGVFNMFTGAGDVSQMGDVATWNYSSHQFFPHQCGRVRGSAGEFYSPGLQKDYVELYSNDLCRSIRLNYKRQVKVRGISSYEYVVDRSLFANSTDNPANSCFETNKHGMIRSGVYDTSVCRFGAPVFVSQPHFYQADPFFVSQVKGLAPKESLHSTYFRIEPRSGVPTEVVARFQVNVLLEPVKGLTILKDVTPTFFPVMWSESRGGVPQSLASKMWLLATLPDIVAGIGWTEIGLGLSMVILAAVLWVTRKKSLEDRCPILSQSLAEESGDENVFNEQEEERGRRN